MKNIFYILIAAFSLLLHAKCVGQNNIVYGAGISYTNGVPTFVPPSKSARVAIDTVTSKWYEYATPGGWRWSGDRVQDISGCAAPSYTPGKAQSRLVLNACTEAQNGHGPELYKYTGSEWLCLNCGGNYTAGDGIDITGTEITNTAPDQVVSITGAGINAVTGTYPNFTVTGTEVDGSTTNEIQTLSVAGSNLSISGGNTVTLPTPSSTLDALTDVTITSPTNAQLLQYNTATTQWVNATLSAITGSGASTRIPVFNGTGSLTSYASFIFPGETQGLIVGGIQFNGYGTNVGWTGSGFASTGTNRTMRILGGSNTNGTDLYGVYYYFGTLTNRPNATWIGHEFTGQLQSNNSAALTTFTSVRNNPIVQHSLLTLIGYEYNPQGGDFGITNHYAAVYRYGSVGIGPSNPSSTAKLEVTSTTQGVLFPRMTGTQRDAIASPPDGLVLYNTTAAKLQVRSASAWVDLH